MTEQPNREVQIMNAALELRPAERAAYLDQACAGDTALRRQVEALLQAHEQAESFLEAPPAGLDFKRTVRLNIPLTEKPGDRIGRYKLLQQIGEGGCGVVYMAEQEEPVRRRVALKVIKLGMDTKQVIARFEAERQALALMDHPNIAKVLDAGATETGRPYFVMELVRGVKITEFCDENKLSTEERLKLFIHVCQAIQHAHQKGVIHRDIKPSNILVTINDGVPVPKVIDFGIAKATQGRLTDHTLFTAFEQFIGTPAYMSPEQAVMTSLDIDTRSDIYSLGVLLYELLTGRTPFDQKELLAAGLDEMRRTIREKEPPRPSTCLSTMAADALTSTAKLHHTDAPKLIHLLRGDLDWIVMQCLEKDRSHRYETANGLAADLARHLNNEPIAARPPSNLYRFQKLVRRNKLAFAAGGALALVLMLGVMASTLQAVRATRAEREQSRLRSQAETEAAKANAISDFLQQMLGSANPDALKGAEYSVRQMLDEFSAGLANQLEGQPEVEASVRATIGRAYYRLGFADKALAHHERALTLRRRIFGEQAELTAESHVDCAWTYFEQTQYAKGEPHAREALDIYRKRGAAGQPVLSAWLVLQRLLTAQGRFAEVDAVTEEASGIARKSPGVGFADLASIIHGLAEVRIKQSRYSEAEALAREAVAMHRRLRRDGELETAWALVALGSALSAQQKLDQAEDALQEALGIFRKQYVPGHKSIDAAMGELEAVLIAKKDFVAMEKLYREILAGQRAKFGNDSPVVAKTLNSLAANLQSQGKPAAVVGPLTESLGILLKQRGQEENLKLPSAVRGLSSLLVSQGQRDEAAKLYEESLRGARESLGESHPVLGEMLHDYGEFLFFHQSKFAAAAEQYRRSLPIRRAKEDDNLAWTLRNLGFALVCAERPKEAEESLRESLALYRKLHREDHLHGTAWASVWLGEALHQQQRLPEAERVYCEAMVAFSKTQGIGGEGYNALPKLIRVLTDQKKSVEAEMLLKDILSRQRESREGQQNTTIISLLPSLTEATRKLLEDGEFARAEPLARECVASHEKLMPDDWQTFDLKSTLGGSLLGQKQFAAAEPLLLSGFQGMKERETDIPLSGKPRLKEGLQRLLKLYEVTGRSDQVAEWKQRLDEFTAGNK